VPTKQRASAIRRNPTVATSADHVHTIVCVTIECMNVDRFSMTMAPDLGAAVRAAAERSQKSVSAWISEAAEAHLRNELLSRALDDYEAATGAFTDEELRAAAASLGVDHAASPVGSAA
jgi:hypothetical protein